MLYRPAGNIGNLAHCPTNVFTSTPGRLNSPLYQCCQDMTNVQKLANTSAFASLVLTFTILLTTLLFYPFVKPDEGLLETIKAATEELQE